MKTETQFPEVLHFDPAHPCCATPSSADLFPDLLNLDTNKRNRGRVVTDVVESCGVVTQNCVLTVDTKAWEECVKSLNFRACYDLSMAKLALQEALAAR